MSQNICSDYSHGHETAIQTSLVHRTIDFDIANVPYK